MRGTIFVVNDEPYCLWAIDLPERNKEFLRGVDVAFFSFVQQTYLSADDEKRAVVAMRLLLHHATETLFSFLGAFIQAPDCTFAWISKCTTGDLRKLIQKINSGQAGTYNLLQQDQISWKSVSERVFAAYLPGSDRQKNSIQLFADFWQRMAREMLNETLIDEYNSMKHGFRVNSGGFTLSAGIERDYGVEADAAEMSVMGHSPYGIKFFKILQVFSDKKSRSLKSVRTCVNWSIEQVSLTLQLVGMSITNVVSALKIANGFPASDCKFERPAEDGDFDRSRGVSLGLNNLTIDHIIDEGNCRPVTKEELIEALAKRNN